MVAGLPDVVYLVRPGDSNEELRHSLRSLVNLPHRKVWIAGHMPRWVTSVEHLPVRQRGGAKWENQEANLRAACEHPDVSETFVMFNDDFYVVRPVERVPVLHRGLLTGVVEATLDRNNRYTARIRATSQFLGPDALAYDWIHVPLPIVKAQMRETLDRMPRGLLFRSVYGNEWRIGGTEVGDAKINRSNDTPPDGMVFLSTSDQSFRSRPVGRWLRRKFSEPCRYEK